MHQVFDNFELVHATARSVTLRFSKAGSSLAPSMKSSLFTVLDPNPSKTFYCVCHSSIFEMELLLLGTLCARKSTAVLERINDMGSDLSSEPAASLAWELPGT